MRLRLLAASTSLALSLSACQVVGPDYALPEDAAINRADAQGELATRDAPVISAPVPADWWRLYHAPELERLVEQALAANTDLRVAAANLGRAAAQVTEAEDRGGFEESLSADLQRTQVAGQQFLLMEKVPVVNFANLNASLSYQFDLFGKLQRGVEASRADADAAQAAADLVRINVVARVVSAYAQVCSANEEREVAQHSLDLQRQSLELTEQLHAAGRGNETEVTRSATQFKSLRAALPRYTAAQQAGIYQLAMLTAQPASALPPGVTKCRHLPELTQPLPVGNGAELLKRRPDIRQAERQLAAATARIGVATGELYPDISIGASTGLIGILDDMGDPSTQHWGFGPLIHWNIPTTGARARVQQAEAATQASLAHFDGVVLNALRETQTALAQYAAALQQHAALDETARSAQLSAEQTHAFYQAGRESFLAELEAQRTQAQVAEQLAASQSQVVQAQIGLFMALGGGWQQATAALSSP
ncbi:RND transporter [Pseudomonas taiwanensis]|uniref:efflux transporter outer membrane subunit n=1 Tax=Pseudomonas taiwanensis TaxID=470150 RepID=UPI0015BA0C54|nr:efflux transporter outer membrane subunit [Pseudomonas taiwanensis]NWL81111.1 RND transporter [Pseudomonas taiwanensis]